MCTFHGLYCNYYTAVLNAVECPIHLNGASQRSVVNYFSITDRCLLCQVQHVPLSREVAFLPRIRVFRSTLQVVQSLFNPSVLRCLATSADLKPKECSTSMKFNVFGELFLC